MKDNIPQYGDIRVRAVFAWLPHRLYNSHNHWIWLNYYLVTERYQKDGRAIVNNYYDDIEGYEDCWICIGESLTGQP